MSMSFIERSQPPGDRNEVSDRADDMPLFQADPAAVSPDPSTEPACVLPYATLLQSEPLETALAAVSKHLSDFQHARLSGDWTLMEASAHAIAQVLTDNPNLGPQARVVAKAVTAARIKQRSLRE